MKRFVFWIVLLLLFDALTCQSLRTMIQPQSKLELVTSTPVACSYVETAPSHPCDEQHRQAEVSSNKSPNVTVAPLPTCQAVFDPAKTGGCARREVGVPPG